MKERLSEIQLKTIEKMEHNKWYSAYDLHVGLNTLWALRRKGYIRRCMPVSGELWFPRSAILWTVNYDRMG